MTPESDRTARAASPSIAPAFWLLPAVFAIHDGEELFTMPGWIAAHRQELDQLAHTSDGAARLMQSLETTTPQVAIGFWAGLLTWRPAVATAIIGLVLLLPGALLGRLLIGG